MKNTTWTDELSYAAGSLSDATRNLVSPRLRLGITGLSRAGKTVCITALTHALLNAAPLPLFEPARAGRIRRCWLQPQPDRNIPRFAYEEHLAALTAGEERRWPESTRRISELRLMLEYEPQGFFSRTLSGGRLALDIVDYPGEWLLDLPLLDMDFITFSDVALHAAEVPHRKELAAPWLKALREVDVAAPFEEPVAAKLAGAYRAYLAACRAERGHYAALRPGRFLMPGDLEGSPALTFCPLPRPESLPGAGSLWREMEKRYQAYVHHVVRPFFFDHFARLDAQLVLVDVLSAINAGPAALADLRETLHTVMASFRLGRPHLFARRVHRIVFAATRADLLPSAQHERLRRILALLVEEAAKRAKYAGVEIDTLVLAAIRATREGTVAHEGEELPVVIGVPETGETLNGKVFDGVEETALYPGELPEDPRAVLKEDLTDSLRFLHFRPPRVEPPMPLEPAPPFPHIRLDATLQFLLADALA